VHGDVAAGRVRVRVAAEREAVEAFALRQRRLVVQVAEQVVERAVLVHQHDEVVEAGLRARRQRRVLLPRLPGRGRPGGLLGGDGGSGRASRGAAGDGARRDEPRALQEAAAGCAARL
jgi:hypothetical protein